MEYPKSTPPNRVELSTEPGVPLNEIEPEDVDDPVPTIEVEDALLTLEHISREEDDNAGE